MTRIISALYREAGIKDEIGSIFRTCFWDVSAINNGITTIVGTKNNIASIGDR